MGRKLCIVWLGILAAGFMLPLVITFTNAFMTETEIFLNYNTSLSVFDVIDGVERRFVPVRLVPREITLGQFRAVLVDQPAFLMLLVNSIRITAPVVVFNLAVSLLTAYGFTSWKWKHKEILFFVYIVVMLMPLQAVLVPNFIIAERLGISQSYWAIIFPGIFAPFGTFLLRQSMGAIPEANFEAARMDGAGEIFIFIFVVMPQMKSGIAALSMLTFIEYWNVVEQAVIFIRDYRLEPLSVFLSRIGEGNIALIFAASVVYMIFPLLWLFLGQEDLQKGIELSGVR
ncbi:MAG: carbohydrate ABC transporter permease [Defluviitaleaceae bacterium]|nr:carbohydrate ABC transporter permease [Defluviitaleaceae bacterium]